MPTRKTKNLHVVYFCQPYEKLTTSAPRGLWRVGHTDQELINMLCKRERVSNPCLDRKRSLFTSAASPCIFKGPTENRFFLPSKKARGLKTEGAVIFCKRCTISCPRRLLRSAPSRPGRSATGLMTIRQD